MKISYHTLLLLTITFSLGITIFFANTHQHHKLTKAQTDFNNSLIIAHDIVYIGEAMDNWFRSVDLSLEHQQTYLSDSIVNEADQLIKNLVGIKTVIQPIGKTMIRFNQIEEHIQELKNISAEVAKAAPLKIGEEQRETLVKSKQLSQEILINLGIIKELIIKHKSKMNIKLANSEESFYQNITLSILAYLSVCLIVWWWITINLVKPIEHLTECTKNKTSCEIVKRNRFHAVPLEVKNLGETLATYVSHISDQNQQLQNQLDELLETRTQLVQSEKLASIGQLAAGIAHEINNPTGYIKSNLCVINEYLKELKNRQISETQTASDNTQEGLAFILEDSQDAITDCLEGIDHIKSIVSDLKGFSHMECKNTMPEDINDLLEKTIRMAWGELKYKAKINKDFENIPMVDCYGGKMSQVFMNLLVNAAHAIKTKGTINIKTGKQNENVYVEIEDDGSGIEQEKLNKIFDAFYTTKPVGVGTGLGLHIAHKIIQSHKGDLKVWSKLGSGTKFRVELPVHQDQMAVVS